VCGRAELLVSNKGSRVVVDYAHTAQALSAILRTLREHFSARLWCVFGCGGDRDSSKRPAMARAAESVADCLVVTSDNPRNEDPQAIVDGILKGLSESACVHVELDRAAAIAYALTQAAPEDCVLIAGKGHEDYQVLSDQTVHFSDREQVLAWREGAA
ncbi:MAG: glutamate ligase domain-containing protein, partial [Granulosicoccaceae bacterium]